MTKQKDDSKYRRFLSAVKILAEQYEIPYFMLFAARQKISHHDEERMRPAVNAICSVLGYGGGKDIINLIDEKEGNKNGRN